nr:EOG090X05AE [Moina brachiata]
MKTALSNRDILAFRGIPYARPPLGELRFRDPVPVEPWNDRELDATKEGPVCVQFEPLSFKVKGVEDCLVANVYSPQKQSENGGAGLHPVMLSVSSLTLTCATKEGPSCVQYDTFARQVYGVEDCLVLNIYTPSVKGTEGGLYPVMIWIPGGGFIRGDGNGENGLYGPEYFMDRDVVIVTINYRVGAFVLTMLIEAPGNYGLLDQFLAMKWVNDYIMHFGGDRDSITIFGESAGGACMEFHLLTPHSKAIAQSGASTATWAVHDYVKDWTVILAQETGCPTENSKDLLSCLRKTDSKLLAEFRTKITLPYACELFPLAFGPRIDSEQKATSHLLLEPDWQSIMQICDIICQGDCQPKYAMAAIKKKFYNSNPYVALYGLLVLESVVKNCGAPIHEEVASKAFMDEFREMVRKTTNDKVKAKVLELIQTWAFAFRNSPKYSIIPDTLNILKAEGYTFPALRESDAMFAADRAPSWSDGDECHRCRTEFSLINRKHHCRACGQVFCSKCTPRSCTLPKFGIEKEVRVCEDCYEKFNSDGKPSKEESVGSKHSDASLAEKKRKEEELKLQEEEELQLAIALSRSEAEHKKEASKTSTYQTYTSPIKESSAPKVTAADIEDPELARYLNRSYWEKKQQQEKEPIQYREKENQYREKDPEPLYPSAPATAAAPSSPTHVAKAAEKYQNGESDEVDEFCSTLNSQLDIFVNRMKSNSSRGRSIANDSSVQTLFMNITTMHTRLLQYIQHQENARAYYEGLQDKLAQARDARAALDSLREEHRERLRREAEEAERQRQIQMAQKLEIMRKKKQEYLQYQRQLAMQRMQEEEHEMLLRMEQQKHMYALRAQIPMPGMPMPGMPGYPPQHVPYMGPPQSGAYPHEMYPSMPGVQTGPGPANQMPGAPAPTPPMPGSGGPPGQHPGGPVTGAPLPGQYPVITSLDSLVNLIQDNLIRDNIIRDNIIRDNLIRDNLIQDNLIQDNLIQDNLIQDIIQDNIIRDNLIRDNLIRDNLIRDSLWVSTRGCHHTQRISNRLHQLLDLMQHNRK